MTVSVIIAVYNCEKFLSNLLCNIKNQTFNDFEVIFVDDSSTDNSYKILEEFCKNDDRFSLYLKENTGVSSARNFGLERAKGKYVVFWDGDDEASPDFLKKTVENADCDKLTVCGFYNDVNSRQEKKVYSENSVDLLDSNAVPYLQDKWLFNTLWNKIFLKKIIDDNFIRFEESFSMGEDLDFVLQYVKHVNGYKVINEPLYTYFVRNSNASHRFHRCFLDFNVRANVRINESFNPSLPSYGQAKKLSDEFYYKGLIGVLWHYCKFYKADKKNKKYIKSTLVKLNEKGIKKVKVNAFLTLVIKLKSVALTRFYYKTVLKRS